MLAAHAGLIAAVLAVVVVSVGASTARAGKGPAFRYILVGHIGSKGSGRGQFPGIDLRGPGGVAVDQVCGDVYISDLTRKVIHHYDQDGNHINDIGGPGTGPGELEQPLGVFVRNPVVQPLNPLGPPSRCKGGDYVWVADYGNHLIAVFKP